MTNLINPSAIIFINSDINAISLQTIQHQMNIDITSDFATFNSNVANSSNYTGYIHGKNLRLLVLVPLTDQTNRNLADIVLSYSGGMVYVEQNKLGPPGKALTIERVYLQEFLH